MLVSNGISIYPHLERARDSFPDRAAETGKSRPRSFRQHLNIPTPRSRPRLCLSPAGPDMRPHRRAASSRGPLLYGAFLILSVYVCFDAYRADRRSVVTVNSAQPIRLGLGHYILQPRLRSPRLAMYRTFIHRRRFELCVRPGCLIWPQTTSSVAPSTYVDTTIRQIQFQFRTLDLRGVGNCCAFYIYVMQSTRSTIHSPHATMTINHHTRSASADFLAAGGRAAARYGPPATTAMASQSQCRRRLCVHHRGLRYSILHSSSLGPLLFCPCAELCPGSIKTDMDSSSLGRDGHLSWTCSPSSPLRLLSSNCCGDQSSATSSSIHLMPTGSWLPRQAVHHSKSARSRDCESHAVHSLSPLFSLGSHQTRNRLAARMRPCARGRIVNRQLTLQNETTRQRPCRTRT
ncbi:hypothetical protein C8Q74DRAFT_513847 [Fomes fomentarius]|nr:hypothetical protein C8Q74DRAFT_513847 [Fomes fomentarius]